ncbi:MAG: hypothetical protein R2795_04105 [Saprospiraceae bacterium]
MIRVNLWSSPRNISTALMYSFAQRKDTTVVDEPLYAYYLTHYQSDTIHPGFDDIIASQSTEGQAVIDKVILGNDYTTPVVIFKQMTHHLLSLPLDFLHHTLNVLLIRNPREILASYTKVIQQPTPYDIGIPQQNELYAYLRQHNLLTAIVDANHLLRNPAAVLSELCGHLGIPFTEDMLHWPAGPRAEDGVWAPYWYHNVHQSTGFQPWQEKQITLAPAMEAVAESCRAAYELLLADPLCLQGKKAL